MPLLMLSGLPCSGKTSASKLVKDFFVKNGIESIYIINDEFLGILPDAYHDPKQEKIARASMLSAIERYLSNDSLVICDGMNYIKGFRYQLYCIARAIGTTSALLYTAISSEESIHRNQLLGKYTIETCSDLISRFEEPDDRKNRWDAPLFTLLNGDDLISLYGQSLLDALIHKKPPKPNLSTISKPMMNINYLYELDKLIKECMDTITDAQRQGHNGGPLKWSKSTKPLMLPSCMISLSSIRNYKQGFLKLYNIQASKEWNLTHAADGLVEYLNTCWGNE